MLEHYLPIVVFAGLAVMVGVVPMVLGYWLSPSDLHEAKQAPFECGFAPVGDANQPFDLRYYLVAILFILFDLRLPSVSLGGFRSLDGWHCLMGVFIGADGRLCL